MEFSLLLIADSSQTLQWKASSPGSSMGCRFVYGDAFVKTSVLLHSGEGVLMAVPSWEFPLLSPGLCESNYPPLPQRVNHRLQPGWDIGGQLTVWGGKGTWAFSSSPVIGPSTGQSFSSPCMASLSPARGSPCADCGLLIPPPSNPQEMIVLLFI